MNNLLTILSASTLADLPPVCRPYWEDDDEFADLFGCCDDDAKSKMIATALKTCLDMSIRGDNNILRMCMLSILCREDEYEDDDEEDVQQVTIPVIAQPDDSALRRRIEELERENAQLKQQIPQDPVEPKPARPVPVPGRGRGRPSKYPNAQDHRCVFCDCGLSSHGALYNHYHSKAHNQKVKNVLEQCRTAIQQNPDLHTKLIVNVFNRREGPDFSTENPCEADIDNLLDYVLDGVNPIIDVLLVELVERTTPAGRTEYSRKKLV